MEVKGGLRISHRVEDLPVAEVRGSGPPGAAVVGGTKIP